MRKIILSLALACVIVPTSACVAPLASTTVVDEQGATTAELAYKTWRIAVETGVNSGVIKGATATKAAELDNRLFAALQTVEAAYATGNSASIAAATASFNSLLATGYATIGGK